MFFFCKEKLSSSNASYSTKSVGDLQISLLTFDLSDIFIIYTCRKSVCVDLFVCGFQTWIYLSFTSLEDFIHRGGKIL